MPLVELDEQEIKDLLSRLDDGLIAPDKTIVLMKKLRRHLPDRDQSPEKKYQQFI